LTKFRSASSHDQLTTVRWRSEKPDCLHFLRARIAVRLHLTKKDVVLADPDHVEDAQATAAIHTAIALGVEKLDSTPLVPQSLALSVHRELAASGLDRLMIKIKTARRKLTFIRGEIKELVTDF